MLNIMNGLALGKVVNNSDPEGQGKVQVLFTSLGQSSEPRWCSVASVAAGNDRGFFFMPENEDEVIVAFDQGDFDHAFIIGYPWNPVQLPPSTAASERMIRSREGHTIRFIDSEENGGDHGALIIQDAHQNVISLTNGVVTIESKIHMELVANSMRIMGRVVNPLGGEI